MNNKNNNQISKLDQLKIQADNLMIAKKWQEAIEVLNQIIKVEPNNAEAFYNRGIAKYGLKQYQEAIQDYDQAIRLKPDYAEAFNNRGNAKAGLKQYQEAIQDYDQAIRLKPDYAEAFNNRGIAKYELKQYQEAIQDYDQAIRLKPDYAEAFNNRGNAKNRLKQYQEAIQDYDQAIRLKPDYAEAFNNRGIAKYGLKQHTEAIKDYDQAIRLKPVYANAFYNRGLVKRELGDEAGAIEDFKEANKIDPSIIAQEENKKTREEVENLGEEIQGTKDFQEILEELKTIYSDEKDNWFKYSWIAVACVVLLLVLLLFTTNQDMFWNALTIKIFAISITFIIIRQFTNYNKLETEAENRLAMAKMLAHIENTKKMDEAIKKQLYPKLVDSIVYKVTENNPNQSAESSNQLTDLISKPIDKK